MREKVENTESKMRKAPISPVRVSAEYVPVESLVSADEAEESRETSRPRPPSRRRSSHDRPSSGITHVYELSKATGEYERTYTKP